MKLHLPKQLFSAVLAAFTLAAPVASTLGSVAWGYRVAEPTGAGNLWAGDYAYNFTITEDIINNLGDGESKLIAAYCGTGVTPSGNKQASGIVLGKDSNGALYITIGQGRTNTASLETSTGFTFSDQYETFTGISAGTYTIISNDNGSGNVEATLIGNINGTETSVTEDGTHSGKMNGGTSTVDSYFNSAFNAALPGNTATWAGTESSSTWDHSSKVWGYSDTVTADRLYAGCDVVFGTEGNKNVSITGPVFVDTVTVNDNYTFTGSSSADIDATRFTIASDKTLTLASTISLSGTSTISGNVAVAENGTLTIAGSVSFASGSLSMNSNATVVVNSGNTLTLSSTVTGTGTVTNNGTINLAQDQLNHFGCSYTGTDEYDGSGYATGDLTVFDSVSYSGTVYVNGTSYTVDGGKISLGTDATKWNSYYYINKDLAYNAGEMENATALVVTDDKELDVAGIAIGGHDVILQAGAELTNSSSTDPSYSNAQIGTLTLTGDATVSGSGDFGIVENSHNASSITLNGHTLTKTGGNTFYAVNLTSISGSGKIDVKEGVFEIGRYKGTTTNASEVVFNTSGGTLSLGNNNTLIAKAITGTSGTTITGTTGTTLTVSPGAGEAYEFSGTISGSISLVKNGDGTQTLSSKNTYTGGTTINGGTLKLGADGALGSGTAAVTVNSGTLDVNGKALEGIDVTLSSGAALTNSTTNLGTNMAQIGTLTLTGDATVSGSGNFGIVETGHNASSITLNGHTLTKTGTNTFYAVKLTSISGSGKIDVKEGIFKIGEHIGTTTNASEVVFNTSGGTLSLDKNNTLIAKAITGTTGTITGTTGTTLTLSPGAGETYEYGGTVSGALSLVKNGAGTQTLSGANTYTGGTTINAGTLVAANAGALGTGAVSVAENATLQFDLASVATVSNVISGAGAVTKTGDATLTLSGANTYTGGTTISAGTLKIGNASALGTGGVTVGSEATLDLNGSSINGAVGNGKAVTLQERATLTNTGRWLTQQEAGQLAELSLEGNAVVVGNTGGNKGNFGLIATDWGYTKLGMGDRNTLSKQGNSNFWLVNTEVTGTGTIDVQEGLVQVGSTNDNASGKGATAEGVVFKTSGGTLGIVNNATLTAKGVEGDSGKITGTAGTTLALNSSDNHTYGGSVEGSLALTKSGTGTQTFSGASSTFASIAVNGGAITLSGENTTVTGAVSLNTNSALNVSGGSANVSGAVSLGANSALNVSGGSANVSGALTVSGTGVSIAQSGEGALNLLGGVTVNEGASASITGTLTLGNTIVNDGTLTLNGRVNLLSDLTVYSQKDAGNSSYSLGDGNGFYNAAGAQYWLTKSSPDALSSSATTQVAANGSLEVYHGDVMFTVDPEGNHYYFTTGNVAGTRFFVTNGNVTVDSTVQAAATDGYTLQGGNMQITEGSVNTSDITYTSGTIDLSDGATLNMDSLPIGLTANDLLTGKVTATPATEGSTPTGKIVVSTTGLDTGKVSFTSKYKGVLELATGGTFVLGGSGDNSASYDINLTSLAALNLSGGKLQMYYANTTINSMTVSEGSEIYIDDMADSKIANKTDAVKISSLNLNADLLLNTNWKSNLAIGALSGAADLNIKQTNSGESTTSNVWVDGVSNAFTGNINLLNEGSGKVRLTLNLGEGDTINASQLNVAHNNSSAVLTGSGVYNLGSSSSLGSRVSLDSGWTGTVQLDRARAVEGLNLNDYGNADSTIRIQGVKGYLVAANTENQPVTFASDIIFENTGQYAALELSNGYSGDQYIFTGAISGAGNFIKNCNLKGAQSFTFSGDVSGWNRGSIFRVIHGTTNLTFDANATSIQLGEIKTDGNADAIATVTFSNENAVNVNSKITKGSGSTLNVVVDAETTFANEVQASRLDVRKAANFNNTLTVDGEVTVASESTLKLDKSDATHSIGTLSAEGTVQVVANNTLALTGDTHSISDLKGRGAVKTTGDTATTLTISGGDFNGTISSIGAGSLQLVKTGTGDLVLQSGTANTYTGGTVINGGKVITNNENSLGTGNVELAAGGTLQADASLTIQGAVTNAGTIDVAGGSATMNSTVTSTGTINVATTGGSQLKLGEVATITANGGEQASMSNVQMSSTGISSADTTGATKGSVSDAQIALAQMQADASFTIADMTLTNTTITAASVNIAASKVSGSVVLNVVKPTEAITAPDVSQGGTGGEISFSYGLALVDSSSSLTLNMEVPQAILPSESGLYTLTITLNGFAESFDFSNIDSQVVFGADSWLGKALTGASTSVTVDGNTISAGAAVAQSGGAPSVSYNATGGNVGSLVITINGLNVPEPASATLGLAALMMLCARRRRKA